MPRRSNDFDLEPNWHFDFRDATSLPEDSVVRVRFLVNTCSAAVTVILLILVGWQTLVRASVAAQLRFWNERIAAHQHEYDELQVSLRDYMGEAGRIKDAYDLVYSPFVPSVFILNIGRTLPDRMTIDAISYADKVITLRGSLAEPPERASRVLGGYIETLRKDPRIGPLFSDISAPSLDRSRQDNTFNFLIVLKLPGAP
ncbi:MAG TPA: hypothetical protein VMD31_10505 [Opitutaceae bacterium]|nr:hypothetical protein [Opitutaceae bacterium]